MTVVVKADELEQLLDPDAEVERLATGFIFTEGPIWNAEGEFLLFSDMPGDVRRRWSERDGVEEVMRPANKCNGMVYDADGNLLVCEHVTSSLVREQPDGTRETIASHFRGKELKSPNDVVDALGRDDLLQRPVVRPRARLRRRARARPRLPGRLPDPGRRRRARARGRRGRVRAAQRAVLLAGRVAALHQRHRTTR